jgi:PAS domain-containing protein
MMGRWTGLLVACAVALAALGYGYYGTESRQIRRERYQAIAAIGALKADQLQLWRQGRLDHAAALSRAPSVTRQLAAHQLDANTDLTAARGVVDTGARTYGYAAVYVLATNGQRLLATGTQADSPVEAQKEMITAALADNNAVMGGFFRGDDGRVYVDTAAAVRNLAGQPTAVVVLRTDAQKLLFPTLQTWPTPSPTAETVLVRREGDEVVFLNEMRHREGSALVIREPIANTDLTTVKAVLGATGPTEGTDYRGVAVLADLRPVPNSDWFLVAKLDADEVWAEARYRAGVAVILITLMILGGAGAVAAFYRKQQAVQFKGLYESMVENEQLLSEAETVGQLGSFVFDLKANEFKSSENLDRVLGFGPEHPRTREGWLRVVHPADLEGLDAYFARTTAARGGYDHSYRIIHGVDKSERWVHSKARIDYTPTGSPQRMVGIIQDVTNSRTAEEKRLLEDQRYQRQRNALIQLATSAPPKDDASLNEAIHRLTEVAARTLDVDRVSIWRYNGSRTGIRCLDLYERPAHRHSSGLELSATDNPAYFQALLEADVLAADDAYRDERTRAFSNGYLVPLGITSMMDAVIRLGGGVVGVLCCEHTGRQRRWSHDEQTFVVALANLVAMSLSGSESRPRLVD